MDLKYSKIIKSQKEKKATFFLFGIIGEDINGDYFASELRYIAEGQNIKNITILINSAGGNVFQGYSIIAAVEYLQNNGTNFIFKNVGIAYSMAGVLLASGNKRISLDYGTIMIHDPRFAKKANVSDSEKELISKVADSLATLIAGGCGKEVKEVRALMSKEKTFSSEEAKEFGIIDEVEITGKSIEKNLSNTNKMVACAALYNNSNLKKENNMKLLNEALGLNAEASEIAALQALKNMSDKSKDKDGKIISLTNELKLSNSKVERMKEENDSIKEEALGEKAKVLIAEAVKGGKIQKEGTKKWIENAIKDFDGTKELLDGLSGTPVDINGTLTGGKKSTDGDAEKAKKFEELLEDPIAMDNMDPAERKVLETAFNLINTAEVSILN